MGGGAVLLVLATAGAALLLLTDRWRADNQRQRDRTRRAFDIVFPHDIKHQSVLGIVQALAGMLSPAGPDLLGVHTFVLEAEASREGRRYRLYIPRHLEDEVRHQLQTHAGGISIAPAEPTAEDWMVGWELKKSDNNLAITIPSVEAAARIVLGGLAVGGRDGAVLLQWVFAPAWWRIPLGAEGETRRLPRGRLAVSGRIAARASTRQAAWHLAYQVWHALNSLATYQVALKRRTVLPLPLVLDRVRRRAGRRWLFPVHLSASELAVFSAIPADVAGDVQGLPTQHTRSLHPDPAIATSGVPFAVSNAPETTGRPLTVTREGRLQHTMVLGPTGSGKSNALAGIALGDIASGAGCTVLGPPDLIEAVLERIPASRADDVIVFEPARGDHAIGLDVFAGAEPAVAADHVLTIFKELHNASWGPRLEQHLRNALNTLALQPGTTLCDIPRLLTDGLYRDECLRSLTSPQLQLEWAAYNALTPRARATEIAPVLNKVKELLATDRLRATFGQRNGALDVPEVLRSRKILLIALPAGELGQQASRLIGSVVISLFWRAILARSREPATNRPYHSLIIDEAPVYLNLPVALPDMLAQARAYRTSITLALQNLDQFPKVQRSGVLANARNKMVFHLPHDDARTMGKEFGLADPDELSRLRRYEVMVQLMTDEGPSRPTTGMTQPLGPGTGLTTRIRQVSAGRYGRLRHDVLVELDAEYGSAQHGSPRRLRSLQPVGVEP